MGPAAFITTATAVMSIAAGFDPMGMQIEAGQETRQQTAQPYVPMEIGAGIYVFGEDIPVGSYNIDALRGSGVFFYFREERYPMISLMIGFKSLFDAKKCSNLRGDQGNYIELWGSIIVRVSQAD